MEERRIFCRLKAELEKFHKYVDKMEEKARQIDVKLRNKQQTKKNEDFNESSKTHCRYWRAEGLV